MVRVDLLKDVYEPFPGGDVNSLACGIEYHVVDSGRDWKVLQHLSGIGIQHIHVSITARDEESMTFFVDRDGRIHLTRERPDRDYCLLLPIDHPTLILPRHIRKHSRTSFLNY